MPSFGLPGARAEASRRNGAKSKGPKTPEGKARSAQNALKHGLRAQKYVVLPDEDAAAFEALQAALMEELAPEGALQAALAQRVVAAAWRLERAERLEAELFARQHVPGGNLGLALIRDCNGARAFDTLLRYRGGTLAELWRALRTLKALQAEHAARSEPLAPEPRLTNRSQIGRKCVTPAPCRAARNADRTREPRESLRFRSAGRASRPEGQPASALLPPGHLPHRIRAMRATDQTQEPQESWRIGAATGRRGRAERKRLAPGWDSAGPARPAARLGGQLRDWRIY